jgi:formylmethanofuran dehydrogenase subunit E
MREQLSHEQALAFLNRFHGHIGPYVVLGYRAGLVANRVLGQDPFCKRAHTMTGLKPPVSCFTDGVQLGSCCTLGKGNITVSDEGEPRVRFELKDGSEGIERCSPIPKKNCS